LDKSKGLEDGSRLRGLTAAKKKKEKHTKNKQRLFLLMQHAAT
jgi:hypothetical protein